MPFEPALLHGCFVKAEPGAKFNFRQVMACLKVTVTPASNWSRDGHTGRLVSLQSIEGEEKSFINQWIVGAPIRIRT